MKNPPTSPSPAVRVNSDKRKEFPLAQSQNRRPNYRTMKAKPKDERTKFDKWFDEQVQSQTDLQVVFEKNPLTVEQHGSLWIVTPLVCDRYFLFLHFVGLDENMWVAKSNILSVAISVDGKLRKGIT